MTDHHAGVDWQDWLRRWDVMQAAYLPEREERFTAMLDVLGVLLPASFVAVDLACGPGAISQRLLARFPEARCLAMDYDPVLLALGRGALGDVGGRLRWVEADLRDPAWHARLGEQQVDAVLSTTALHWLGAGDLARVYHGLGTLVRPGGVFLNGDHLRFASHLPTLQRVVSELYERQGATSLARQGSEGWRQWWDALAKETTLRSLLDERARRFPGFVDDERVPIAQLHEAALRDAGFREVGIIWRRMEEGVILAVR